MRKLLLIILFLTFLSPVVFAGGYQVGLLGIRQTGMGLVGTSLASDPSTMFYNPGGLSFLKNNYNFSLGVSGINSYVLYQKTAPSITEAETENPLGAPFFFYGSFKINDKISAGVSVNTPYGNGLSWGENWVGRYLIQDISMRAIFIQPTVSYKLNDKIGFGAGFVIASGKVEMNRALPVQGVDGEGTFNLEGNTVEYGFNLGVLYKPIQKLQLGLNYRSSVDMNVDDAKVDFTVPLSLQGNFPDNEVSTKLPLPANLDFGASYQVTEKVLLAMTLNYVFWSSYDSLIFDFKTNTPALQDSRNPRLYSNRMIFRLGCEYAASDKLALRLGGYYDPSPVNDQYFSPETPSLNSLGLTAGLSWYPVKRLSLDLSFLYINGFKGERNYLPDNFSGTYKAQSFIPGIGISYSL